MLQIRCIARYYPHYSRGRFIVSRGYFLDELKPTAVRTGHSTAREAATIAKEAQVKKLMIDTFPIAIRLQSPQEEQDVFPAYDSSGRF
ncbi:hypothetical protein MWN41_03510 [Ornithobacterium rhinotracheale]|uniref:hypothetical protein n=1 Tax=Ornithobacterium rhinotracheale TaxID=28251 RepID=UPI001FF4686A|nr:hypothetical protein [Ornithobacterium rhinotracheale]MCK0202085.1 hypothetical protein [Ornithobacterium rhinotracheale]